MLKKNESPLCVKSKAFALRVIRLYRHLVEKKNEFVLSKQVLRSGTSIGANVREGVQAQSRADFVSKLSIALKEGAETEYWIELLNESGFVTDRQGTSLQDDLSALQKMLTSSIKTAKSKL